MNIGMLIVFNIFPVSAAAFSAVASVGIHNLALTKILTG